MRTNEVREFDAEDLDGALAFIEELPDDLRRVYVEVWDKDRWRFVYGDDRQFVSRLLGLVVHSRRFRLRGVDLTRSADGPPIILRDLPTPLHPSNDE